MNHMNHWKQTHDSACLLELPNPCLCAYYDTCNTNPSNPSKRISANIYSRKPSWVCFIWVCHSAHFPFPTKACCEHHDVSKSESKPNHHDHERYHHGTLDDSSVIDTTRVTLNHPTVSAYPLLMPQLSCGHKQNREKPGNMLFLRFKHPVTPPDTSTI